MNRDSNKQLGFILLGIGGLAFLLYLIFHQLATEYLDLPMAVATFVVVCMLLILSLAFGFFAVSLIVLPVSIERWRTREAKSAK
jgi:uncharacterized membrane protein